MDRRRKAWRGTKGMRIRGLGDVRSSSFRRESGGLWDTFERTRRNRGGFRSEGKAWKNTVSRSQEKEIRG